MIRIHPVSLTRLERGLQCVYLSVAVPSVDESEDDAVGYCLSPGVVSTTVFDFKIR